MESSCRTQLVDERFLLLEALGRGGMGTVYRAFDRADQRLVALKVSHVGDRPGPAHPLSAEFESWCRLRHPNIVQAYEMAHAESGPIPAGTPYLVLEHIRGRPVHRALRPGQLSDAIVERVAAQLLAALDHVHAAGSVHRDLKPGNVLVERLSGRGSRFKLTDFGLATKTGASSPVGSISGSLPYVAPESLLGLPLDGRADLYGLGILLYRLATGELPVPGGSPCETLRWHLDERSADPARVRAGISPRLARLVRRLTLPDREARPVSARSALGLLGRGVTSSESGPRRVPLEARGALAALRLALDAARLGARRVFHLPAEASTSTALQRELAVWSQVRGLRFHRLDQEPERLVLRLLADRGGNAVALLRRFGLDRWLQLDLLGDVALRDPGRGSPEAAPACTRHAARAVTELILDCSRLRPLVLSGARDWGQPVAREVERRLIRRTETGPSRVAQGGLLLVVDGAAGRETAAG
jgi:hypothetical protein